MKKLFILLTLFSCYSFSEELSIDPNNLYPQVKFETSKGTIIVELDRTRAPLTVDNFLTYVVSGEYNNTIFHRVIADFIVQGGGYSPDFDIKKVNGNIVNESGNGLKNSIGTIAMAKDNHPHTANRQFFFNVANNTSLDPGRRWGYTVFGSIIEGEAVIMDMAKVKTDYNEDMAWSDVPVEPIILINATLLPES
ncbi:peptidylprolyl isomerase [Thalassotalea piscium]|uniref:Peptidyl-prolyl cis-trans isomerase n=1 Tax=Thalassotalea piscium TaxID=1230533 RepID=A0A7X0TTC1_9GAMM|nr:peptidylprolyl isomerase [Thalassotalea piscium]MBB6542984.1 peptidyl-prolyl cis-trans isomerase A (cyclophilin A) [Thalassotalea piscium]